MAYNNGFPMSYGQMYQPVPQPISQPVQQNNGFIWVQGEAGAKSYLVAPNTTVQLWDSEAQTIYLKSADATGMPSMKVLDYTIRENANPGQITPLNDKHEEYVTKSEFDALKAELEGIKENMGV